MNKVTRRIIFIILTILPVLIPHHAIAENIDSTNKYAYGENVGWINFAPTEGSGVTVTNTAVTGMAWGENIGWINLSPGDGGVLNDTNGNLSGYAWAENVGWINFNPTGGGVKIDPATGVFSGMAWGENIGWINFAPNGFPVKTAWRGETTPPTGSITINGGAQYTTSTDVTLTLTCADANGCAQMKFSNDNTNWSSPETYATTKAWSLSWGDGTKTVYVKFQDNPGNWSTVYSDTIILDTTAPTCGVSINSGANYTNSASVTLTLSCSDANGCNQMRFRNDDTNVWSTPETFATTKAWTLSSGDGAKVVYSDFKDVPGLWSDWFYPCSATIILDTTSPATTASPTGGTYSSAQSVTLTCNDGSGSGCDKIYYTTDGSTPTTSSPVYSSPINIAATTTLKFFSRDKAANSESVKTETYTINLPPAVVTLIKPNGGESIPSGSQYTIQWKAPSIAVRFKLLYSTNSGKRWEIIERRVRGLSYVWRVPKTKNDLSQCLVKIVGFDSAGNKIGKDISDATFTIKGTRIR
jgi:uncharacterized protein GlcG (DUF336 family)